ncbi:MAG: type II secretion system protein [Nitrospira sp.]
MRRASSSPRRPEAGFSYLMVMMAITVMGLSMTMAARQWKTMVQRELEADLLAKGIEIQTALALYSAHVKAGRVMPGEVYPQTLAELTRPPKPFLRKVYLDPVGRGEWQLLRAPTGGIMGVRSTSRDRPIKQGDFPPAVRHFQGKPTHFDWVFQYPNPSMAAVPGSIVPLAIGQPAQLNQPVRPGENDLSDDSPVEESMDAPADQMDSADFPSTPSADTLSEPPETPVLPLEPAS